MGVFFIGVVGVESLSLMTGSLSVGVSCAGGVSLYLVFLGVFVLLVRGVLVVWEYFLNK
jgi:hypothetical protein